MSHLEKQTLMSSSKDLSRQKTSAAVNRKNLPNKSSSLSSLNKFQNVSQNRSKKLPPLESFFSDPKPHEIKNRIAQIGRVYGNRHRPITVSGPIIRNDPLWVQPNEAKDRVLMFEQPTYDKSMWHHDIISYSRDQSVQVSLILLSILFSTCVCSSSFIALSVINIVIIFLFCSRSVHDFDKWFAILTMIQTVFSTWTS